MSDLHYSLRETLRPFAEEMFEYEAAPVQRGVPAGDRKDYLKFWRLTEDFLTHLAMALYEVFPEGFLICGKNKKKWLKLKSGRRGIYLPYFGQTEHSASVPQWLSWTLTRGQIASNLKGHPDSESLLSLVNADFAFKHCFGLLENERPVKVVLVDYATGKSSDAESLDGNAHERLSYKMLQYLELLCTREGREVVQEFVVFGNGAFATRRNRFYPSVLMHQSRMASMDERFSFRFLVRVAEYLSVAEQALDWLHPVSRGDGPVIRRRPALR